NIIVISASVLRLYQDYTIVNLFPALIFERLCATILIRDYEKKRRFYISAIPLLFNFTISLLSGINIVFGQPRFNPFEFIFIFSDFVYISNPVIFGLLFGTAIVPSIISVGIVVFNKRRYKNILLSSTYSLSEKYQLKENLRAF
ncbi:hypothetical protein PFISCL1PPCAC_15834, partial [Pristionchus fissidentatus]